MKQLLFLPLSLLLFLLPVHAQLGDFRLEIYNKKSPYRTSEKVAANTQLRGGPLKNLFIGKNYRQEWLEPVQVPVLNFTTDLGGITPKEEGGGRQTRSLEIEDGKGQKWVLRSVRKYPEAVVIPALKGTIAEKIVADGISASYPYGVLSVGTLAKAAGIPYLANTLVFIPDHPALGQFREKYKNTMALLERRTIDPKKKDEKTYNTYEIVPELLKSNKSKIAQLTVLKARLLDNFVMDFDRHEDQWEWIKIDSVGATYYAPIAKDRDQAFFRITGLIPKIARIIQPSLGQLQGFRAKSSNIKTFNFVAKDFDRTFLNELDEQTWNREIDAFLSSVTDTVITAAIKRQPDEVEPLQVQKILQTLKERRRYFKEDMMAYYRFISETVSIRGSNGDEQFIVTRNSDGTVLVQVMQLSSNKPQDVLYQRYFSPAVTKELRLYGLEGDDKLVIRGTEKDDIKIRLIGGPGEDSFINEGRGSNVILYDVSFEENTVVGTGMKNKIDADPMTNEYQRLGMQYTTRVPGIGIELTREGGLFLGPSLRITTPGFRKDPYATKHFFYATRSLQSSAYHFRYDADFTGIAKNTDLLLRSDATLPTVRTYFFGLGNNTVYDKRKGNEHYLASYYLADMSVQARYSPLNWLQLRAGPILQYLQFAAGRNKTNYVSTVLPHTETNTALYDGLWYGGAELRLEINRRNHPTFTTQGMHSNFYARTLSNFAERAGSFRQAGGNISFFSDVLWKRMIVLATSFGADKITGQFQFPQAQYLGFRQNLRGYRFQRFAGNARAYNNSEVRVNLGVRNFYFFKGLVGLIGFHDVGRVWIDNEKTNNWHRGWGGGVWVAPFNKIAVIASLASSKEESSWLQVSFGFQF